MFTPVFEAAEDLRYLIASAGPERIGRYGRSSADRFRQSVTDDNPNLFRIGEHERLRDGTRWNQVTRTYIGGTETPASRTMRQPAAGQPRRRTRGPRDAPAARHGSPISRIRAQGGDTSRIITDGYLIYCASAAAADRSAIFAQAIMLLAQDHTTRDSALTAWLRATYMDLPGTAQEARQRCGHPHLPRVSENLLHRPPTLLDDIDLRAIVLPQERFVAELRAVQYAAVRTTER